MPNAENDQLYYTFDQTKHKILVFHFNRAYSQFLGN